jgi:hypothetical protein
MASRWGPGLLIALLGLLFFAGLVLHPGQTLYSDYSDLLAFHLPSRHFLVASWQETGEVPLWCPYNFGGMPFVHDIQASAFYPLHWPLFLLPPNSLGAATSWLVVFHVIAAGWCMHAYARHRGLNEYGALVAAIGYMFAGKWLLHILAGGHYNMVPLAWLPLILLWLEQAIARGSLLKATWAGGGYSLIILGAYPYVTLYSGLFIAVWTLGTAIEERTKDEERATSVRFFARWLGFGLWTALVAVGLGAVQLLPGLEASGLASRSTGVAVSTQMLLDGLRSLVGLVGPAVATEPNSWENRAGLGILWLTLAVAAPMLGGRRVRFEGLVCLLLFGFVLGGAVLVQWLPGFNLFRLPSRMYLVMALPVALLAGRTVQALVSEPAPSPEMRRRIAQVLLKVTALVVVLAGLFGVMLKVTHKDEELQFHPYWATLILTLPAALWLLTPKGAGIRGQGLEVRDQGLGIRSGAPGTPDPRPLTPGLVWLVILVLDLCSLTWPLVAVRPEAEIYTPSQCVRYLAQHREKHGRVLDFNPSSYETSANHTPLWPGLPAVQEIEPIRGFNPIDVLRYKEFVQFIMDEDKPLRALDQMFTGPIMGTFPIRNQHLADLLGIRYLVQPSDLLLEATVRQPGAKETWTKVEEDPAPVTFNFISVRPAGRDCGLQLLPPYTIYENRHVLPRAFVVPEAAPLPERSAVLAALKATDFQRRVLLEDFHEAPTTAAASSPELRSVTIAEYHPNRVTLQVPDGGAGYLVLTDIWFPGWTCVVDGQPARVYRANYLFRAVKVPAGAHQVVFTMAPASYAWGKCISGWTLVSLVGLSVVLLVVRVPRPRRDHEQGKLQHAAVC